MIFERLIGREGRTGTSGVERKWLGKSWEPNTAVESKKGISNRIPVFLLSKSIRYNGL